MPGDEYRILDEEIYGPDYVQEESSKTEESATSKFDSDLKEVQTRFGDTNIDSTDDDSDQDLDTRNSVLVFSHKQDDEKVTLKDFEIMGVIGRGTFGKVFLGKLKTNEVLYAIKSLRKDVLVEAGQIENVKLEKEILSA